MDSFPFQDKRARSVSFASKCQVIPWTEVEDDDAAAEDALKQRAEERRKGRRRSRLNVFRSLSSSGSTSGSRHESSEDERSSSVGGGSSSNSSSPAKAVDSQDTSARARLSPSLPINRNPAPPAASEKLRRKLISPPPPTPSASVSPLQLRLALASDQSDASTSQDGATRPLESIPKPVAVRKPLSFGPVEDLDEGLGGEQAGATQKAATLRVPRVVNVSRSPQSEDGFASGILRWNEDGNESEEEEEGPRGEMLEEDLNEECVCPDCDQRMIAALSQSYIPLWTRAARKKYLADKKQAQMEGAKKTSKLPSWLRSDGDDEDEGGPSTAARDIKADEVDSKRGEAKVEIVSVCAEEPAKGSPAMDATDASLQGEVEQEVRLRKEEERSKQSRQEMRRLSNDTSSGLRAGGGARAMMRQLEEAERVEKRASIQRTHSQSPSHTSEKTKEENRPMGAVKDPVFQPFTSPRRLSDQTLAPPVLPNGKANGSPTTRTPSPLQHQVVPSQQQKKKAGSPTKEEPVKLPRHPSPSLLIRRELSLGIPVHSNTASPSRPPWSSIHPPTRTPSPRLASPTTLEDIAEVPSTNLTETSLRANSSTGPRRASTIGHSSHPRPSRQTDTATNGKSGRLNRANTVSGKPNALWAEDGSGNGLGLNLSHHVHSFSEGRFGQARHKARNSLKDLVARIKN